MRFQRGEIAHRKNYRPEVQGHVVLTWLNDTVTIEWDINRPKHHAHLSTLRASTLQSDGFFQEPEHFHAVETPWLDKHLGDRERAIRWILGMNEDLLRVLGREPRDREERAAERILSPGRREHLALRRAHLRHLQGEEPALVTPRFKPAFPR